MKREILDFLKMNDVKYRENHPLSRISTIRIGAEADFVVYPDSIEKTIKTVDFLEKTKIRYKILGRMSNVLPPDKIFNGVVVRSDLLCGYVVKGDGVEALAGVSLPSLAGATAEAGLGGIEELSGIPGSLGGGVIGNAGAFGREISDIVSSVTIYNLQSGGMEVLKSDKLEFGYRTSALKKAKALLLSATLSLERADKEDIKRRLLECRERRTATQPVGKPSLGSVFKRPNLSHSAAWYIDECGLKGTSVGGAKISEKHAGFIINQDRATAKDYLNLADYTAECVYKRFGVTLEREVEIM